MKLCIIFFIIITILFFPIKLKLSVMYKENSLVIYLYKLKIFDFKDKLKKEKPKDEHSYHNKNKTTQKLKNMLNSPSIRSLNEFFINSKIKPSIKLNFDLCYSLEDAMSCALLQGFLYSISYIPLWILNNYLNIKDYKINILAKFNDKFINFKSICIIYFNLANIIYILFNVLKILLRNKGSVYDGYAPNR